MQSANLSERGFSQIDYDLHGIVGIRVCNATPADAAVVTRQLGPIKAPLERDPDIVIHFVDELPTPTPVRYLGLNDAGFTDDAFLVLRSKHKARARVQIPFEQIGQGCEIVCERGLPAVPLLIPIINLTALSKGALPLHASAFIYNGMGVLVTGWSKGGKTETLLAFMANGATYVGDEWIYLTEDGEHMYGIPEPMRVWEWHLRELPRYRASVAMGDRIRLHTLGWVTRAMDWAISSGVGRKSAPIRLMSRMLPLLRRQLNVQLPPGEMFVDGARSLEGTPDKLFWVASHETPEIRVESVTAEEIARRMVFSLQEERIDFTSYYLKFRFAFPEARNPLIEDVEELQRRTILRALAGKEAYAVFHPYPVSIPALYDVMSPYLEGPGHVA